MQDRISIEMSWLISLLTGKGRNSSSAERRQRNFGI